MSTDLKRYLAENRAAAVLGRPLARRSGSRCELCLAAGVPLAPWEVPPLPEEPDAGRAQPLCGRCLGGAAGDRMEPLQWRVLEGAAWSEVLPVQVTAVRLLRRLAGEGADWAADLLDGLWLGPEAEAWLAEG